MAVFCWLVCEAGMLAEPVITWCDTCKDKGDGAFPSSVQNHSINIIWELAPPGRPESEAGHAALQSLLPHTFQRTLALC